MRIDHQFEGIERGASFLDNLAAQRLATSDAALPVDPTAGLLSIARAGDAAAFWRAVKPHVDLLAALYEADPTEWQAFRAEVKRACREINIRDLDALAKPPADGPGNMATDLAGLADSRCTLWHDADNVAFASYEVGDHREHWRVESSGFRDWLAFLAHSEMGTAPSSEVLKACTNALAGTAKFKGEQHAPALRVAETTDGYWIDLGDADWRAILITDSGWSMVAHPSVKFIRTKTTRPLPEPARGGDVAALWSLVNVPEGERLLVLAWILESLRAGRPYPLLELTGEQGSAKSSAQRILRSFIDPSEVALRGRPKTVEDIFVAAANSHLISYENLSRLSNDQSDALCTVCTGGGYSARQLFTNGEESVLKAHAPVVLNGISPVVLRPDLLDRTVSVSLPVITHRLTEDEIDRQVAEWAPGIFGGLLALFVDTLRMLPRVQIAAHDLPRMADFCRLGEAMSRALGHRDGTFVEIYTAHRREAISRTLEASPIAQAIAAFVERGGNHHGPVNQLLARLNELKPEHEREDYWPRSPKGLADALRRYAPALRQVGIKVTIETTRRKDGVYCHLMGDNARAGVPTENHVHHVHQVHPEGEIEVTL